MRKSSIFAALQVIHLKERSTSCSSVLMFILRSFGVFLDGDSCSCDSLLTCMVKQWWP